MFCVRLIQHLANANKSESEKTKTLNRLNEIYLEIIKNFYTSPPAPADKNNNNSSSNGKKSAKAAEQPEKWVKRNLIQVVHLIPSFKIQSL